MMHQENITIRLFKVPLSKILNYDDYERAFTGGESGTDHINLPFINVIAEHLKTGSLSDYLGLPLPYRLNTSTNTWEFIPDDTELEPLNVSVLPFLAYQRIYNDYYRNEETNKEVSNSNTQYLCWNTNFANFANYTDDTPMCALDGSELFSIGQLQSVGWERDYFTSALKSSQRGEQVVLPAEIPANSLNISGSATIQYGVPPFDQGTLYADVNNNRLYGVNTLTSYDDPVNLTGSVTGTNTNVVQLGAIGAIALRMAMNLQALLEKFNISGYRLDEQDAALFGTKVKNRYYCDLVGGVRIPISVSEVTQTSQSDNTPLGQLAGKEHAAAQSKLGRVICDERSIIMVCASIVPRTGYSQGLERKWTRKDYLDYYIPELQTVGEQEILNREVFNTFIEAGEQDEINEGTWAYQARYSEYKYIPDSIAGDFRTSLDFWHKSRLFNSLPGFNGAFVKCDPTDRVFAVGDSVTDQHYQGWFYFDVQAIRPMAKHVSSKLW